jgi:hypothetical protein
MWKIGSKDKCIHKNIHDQIYTNLYVEHVCNGGTTLWDLGQEGKEKRTIDSQYQIQVEDATIYTESC